MSSPADLALRFQFENREQQRSTATTGMWLFLATEIMMFGVLFTCYGLYRAYFPRAFAEGSNEMDVWLGAINTFILIASSLTIALAVAASKNGRDFLSAGLMGCTIVLGALFLGIKFYEYYHHWEQMKFPGSHFSFQGPDEAQVQMFFVFYYVMTGLHALHMVAGIAVLSVLAYLSLAGHYASQYHTPVENFGFYWHFVDIVWVFLFPLFYLAGRHLH